MGRLVEIRHVTSDGNKKVKIITDVLHITLDYGFEINNQVFPAIKIISGSERPYHLIKVYEPASLVLALKNCKGHILIDEDNFDPSLLPFKKAVTYMEGITLQEVLKALPETLFNTQAFRIFHPHEMEKLSKGNVTPLYSKNIQALTSLWRATLPTPYKPNNISKKQYYAILLRSIHPHDYRL